MRVGEPMNKNVSIVLSVSESIENEGGMVNYIKNQNSKSFL